MLGRIRTWPGRVLVKHSTSALCGSPHSCTQRNMPITGGVVLHQDRKFSKLSLSDQPSQLTKAGQTGATQKYRKHFSKIELHSRKREELSFPLSTRELSRFRRTDEIPDS